MRICRFAPAALIALGVAAVVPANAGLVITAGFDGTITGDTNAAAIQGVINQAIGVYQNLFSNNVTVKIYFQEGGGLGQSNFFNYNPTYTSFYNGLVANNSNPAAIAALNANGGNAGTNGGINPVNGTTTLTMKSANERAVGINQVANCVPNPTGNGTLNGNVPNNCSFGTGVNAYDGIISLNTQITFPPQPNNGSNYGLLAVTEHEIDEILGLGSALFNCNPNNANSTAACKAAGNWSLGTANASSFGNPSPEDLYRWNAATGGTRTSGTNCQTPTSAFFSYGPSTGNIAQFNNLCNGADFGDWSGSGPRTQDAFATPGANPTIGSQEISALTAIGWSSTVPEPSTYVTLLTSLTVLGFAKRRARR